MRAVIFDRALHYAPDAPLPVPAEGEALVRVLKAGICNTDVEILRGYHGFQGVIGHEFVGVVDENGTPARVVGEISAVRPGSPSRTWFERSQDPERTTIGIRGRAGAFADYVSVPWANLHRVPDSVSDDEAVFVEPLAAGCGILELVHIKPTDDVRVLGDGKLGLLCAMALARATNRLTVVGKHANKLDIARGFGARTMRASEWDGARAADVVVDCTGSAAGIDIARRMLKPRGTLVLKSTYASAGATAASATTLFEALTMVVVDEQRVVGSRCGPFAAALDLLARKVVDVTPLIHARYPIAQALEAFDRAQQPGVLKVLLEMV
ncbi:MAG: alcohol dehydrogenase catalytic domain-containing protein [Thermoflexales bacterium]|nr:alcohol dehydrogenase catalytic domain-containing protein [Thermoflexales bacterium]